ncbi:unnamed protein product [Alopecurus aequalis]
MPSLHDGETSSGSLLSEFEFQPDVHENIYDPDFSGTDPGEARCDHGLPMHKFVAFESKDTGRRFLGCGCLERGICDKVIWIDGDWPVTLNKALVRLWHLYEEEKDNIIKEGVQSAEEHYKLVLEKRDLEKVNTQMQKELANSLTLEQVSIVSAGRLECEKLMMQKVEKQREKLKEEKKNLEYYIVDLLKAHEVNKEKLKNISKICDE